MGTCALVTLTVGLISYAIFGVAQAVTRNASLRGSDLTPYLARIMYLTLKTKPRQYGECPIRE